MGFGKVGNVGSCALVSLVIDNRLFVANLGDSKGILFSNLKRKRSRSNSSSRFKWI